MPISSSEISNIITGQVGMFSASAQYAQAISSQYGFQAGGSVGIQDPRDLRSGQELQAAGIGAAGAKAASYAPAALAGAAMFNYAPRFLDPFTQGAHMVHMGYRGAGMAGAIGMGVGAAGLVFGAGAAMSAFTQPMISGAQNRGLLNSQIGGIFPNMRSGGINMLAQQVEAMHRQGMGSIRELATLMQQGAATGALDTGSLSQFSTSFRKLVSNVRQVANVLNSSITEASQAISSVKAIGIGSDQAVSFLGAARGIGQAAKLSPGQMMGVASRGSQFAFSAGIERETGAMGAMVSAGIYKLAQRDPELNIDQQSQSRYTQAATRFLLSRRGRTVLGAMMNRDGEFDQERASLIAQGFYTGDQLRGMYKENINNRQMRRHLRNRGTEIAGEFISQFGPEAISGSLEALTLGSNEDGVGRDTEMLQRSLTGLNRRDIQSMRQLAASAPMLKQRLIDEARRGFEEGQLRVSATKAMGIAFDKMIKPLKDQFRDFGARMTEAASQAMEDVTTEFSGRKRPQADFAGYNDFLRTRSAGQPLRDFYSLGDPQTQLQLGRMPGSASGVAAFANYLPSGLRLGAMPEGTSLTDLPMAGFGTLDPMDGVAVGGVGLASAIRFGPGNRNIIGHTGTLLRGMGTGLNRLAMGDLPGMRQLGLMHPGGIANPRYAAMGFTGIGTARGIPRLGSAAFHTAGFLTQGLGRVAGALSLPLMAYGMFNMGGMSERALGYRGVTEGAISGNNASLIRGLKDIGVLDDTHLSMKDIRNPFEDPEGIPVGLGTTDASGGIGTGYQPFLSGAGRERLEQLFSTGGVGRAMDEEFMETLRKSDFGFASDGAKRTDDSLMIADLKDRIMATQESYKDAASKDKSLQRLTPKIRLDTVNQIFKQFNLGDSSAAARFAIRNPQLLGMDTDFEYARTGKLGTPLANRRIANRLMQDVEAADYKSLGFSSEDKAAENLAKVNASMSKLVGGKDSERAAAIKNYGSLLHQPGNALAMFDAQQAFLRGDEDEARHLVNEALSRTDLADGEIDVLRDKLMDGGLSNQRGEDGNLLNQFAADVEEIAVSADPAYAGTGVSPAIGMKRRLQRYEAHRAYSKQYTGENEGSTLFGLEQGRRVLGIKGIDSHADLLRLQSTDPEAGETHVENMVNRHIDELGKMHASGKAPSDRAITNANLALVRAGSAGKAIATANANANMAFRDYDKFKGRKDRNALFLNRQARRMGLDLDFTQFKDKDDLAFLRGGGQRDGMSTALGAELRQFGMGLMQLRGVDKPSTDQVEIAADEVLDALTAHDGNATEAIKRMNSYRPPQSPTASKSASGGMQQQVSQFSTALEGLVGAINAAKGALTGNQ